MSQSTYMFAPPPAYSLPVRGTKKRLAVNRLFFVGRNYHAHAVEMGRPVDKTVEVPFYFTKSPSTLVESGATVSGSDLADSSMIETLRTIGVALGRIAFETRSGFGE